MMVARFWVVPYSINGFCVALVIIVKNIVEKAIETRLHCNDAAKQ